MLAGQLHEQWPTAQDPVSKKVEGAPHSRLSPDLYTHTHSGMYMPSLTQTCISAHTQAYKYMDPRTQIYTNAKKYLTQTHTQTYNSTQTHIIKKYLHENLFPSSG